MIVTIQFRRGTSAQWATAGRVLLSGEPGYDTTLKQLKLGDGTSSWDELSFVTLTPEEVAQVEEILANVTDLDDTRMTQVVEVESSDFTQALAAMMGSTGNPIGDALSATIAGIRVASTVTYSGDLPATETIPLASGGNLVKTYHYDGAGNPTTCDWNYPSGPDYIETFTYDGAGNATGSTFAEA